MNKFYVSKKPIDGMYDILVEGGSEMVRISSVLRIDLDQVRASIWASTGLAENKISYLEDTKHYEIYQYEG